MSKRPEKHVEKFLEMAYFDFVIKKTKRAINLQTFGALKEKEARFLEIGDPDCTVW